MNTPHMLFNAEWKNKTSLSIDVKWNKKWKMKQEMLNETKKKQNVKRNKNV